MLAKRIIPCLDVKDGRVVKGTNFQGLRDMADPVEMARFYNASGADELVFYDITASAEGRNLFTDILRAVASEIFIPLTVGGGIRTLDDFDRVLKCGADKVSVNSGAIADPSLIGAAAKKYGDECVGLSMDVKRVDGQFRLFAKGGREDTGIDAMEWAVRGVENGAGEIVLNSIDTDGVKEGFDLPMLDALAARVGVPIIASGGAGKMEDFAELFTHPGIDAGLAASIFHTGEVDIRSLKRYLRDQGVEIPVDPFAGFRVKPTYAERRYLSASELQAIMDVQLPNYRTGINRDVFVFCAFTGLSHADVVKLTHADIHTDDNGDHWIIDKRQKTGTQFRVKLLPVAEMLYNRYKDTYRIGEKVFPLKGTYKTLNMSLRHVARHAGLSFNPTMHMARHTFAITVTLTQGVPLETVSKMLGQKRITTTQIYARITNDRIGQDMAALSEKLNSVFKVAQ